MFFKNFRRATPFLTTSVASIGGAYIYQQNNDYKKNLSFSNFKFTFIKNTYPQAECWGKSKKSDLDFCTINKLSKDQISSGCKDKLLIQLYNSKNPL